jgi:hypothetical protein
VSDDTRELRDALEATQVALREARKRIEALEQEVAEARSRRADAALQAKVDELARTLAEAREREQRLEAAYETRGQRIQALSAELDRLRATARRTEAPPPPKVRVTTPERSGAPRPPPAPDGAAPSAKSVRVKGERAPPSPPPRDRAVGAASEARSSLPPDRPNVVSEPRTGRVIFGGAAGPGGGGQGEAVSLGPDGRLVPRATPPAHASLAQPAGCLVPALLLALSVLAACAR